MTCTMKKETSQRVVYLFYRFDNAQILKLNETSVNRIRSSLQNIWQSLIYV